MRILFTSAIFIAANAAQLFSSQWIGPVDVFTAQIAHSPVVGVDDEGNAVILATASDDGITFYEKGAQLVQGVIQNLHSYPAIGSNVRYGGEFIPVIAVNAAGNASGLWTEFDGTSMNDFVRAVLLDNNIWGNPTTLTDPDADNVASYSGLGITLDDAGSAVGSWAGQNGTTLEASQYIAPSWSAVQEVPILSSNPANLALVATPSGRPLLAWVSYAPFMYVSYYSGTTWTTQLVSEDVFSSCHPLFAVSINVQNNAMLIWNNASTRGISSALVSGDAIGSIQIVYTPAGDESINALAVAIDNSGNAIALWVSQIGPSTYKVMTSRYSGGNWGAPLTLDTTDLGNSFTNPNIAIDGLGNSYAVWEKDDISGNGMIYYNQYTNANSSWLVAPTLLSAPGVLTSNNPKLSMNTFGGAAVVWSIDPGPNQTIQIVYTENQPNPPVRLIGRQLKSQFLTQTDLVNEIRWSASSSPSIVSYNIFLNGLLVATVPSTAPLEYTQHNSRCIGFCVYQVTAVNAQGMQSEPATVVIQ